MMLHHPCSSKNALVVMSQSLHVYQISPTLTPFQPSRSVNMINMAVPWSVWVNIYIYIPWKSKTIFKMVDLVL